jgi:hypothetical protein
MDSDRTQYTSDTLLPYIGSEFISGCKCFVSLFRIAMRCPANTRGLVLDQFTSQALTLLVFKRIYQPVLKEDPGLYQLKYMLEINMMR